MSRKLSINKFFPTVLIAAIAMLSMSSCTVEDPGYKKFDTSATALHHIADANSFHIIGDYYLPLPCMLYAPDHGWTFLSSSNEFKPKHHGNGTIAIDRYVLQHGVVRRIKDANFPMGVVEVDFPHHSGQSGHGSGHGEHHNESPSKKHDGHNHKGGSHDGHNHEGFNYQKDNNAGVATKTSYKEDKGGHELSEDDMVMYQGKSYELEYKTTLDGGLAGGGMTSYYDFSITKNVFSMILVFLLLSWLFLHIAKAYRTREDKAPTGVQSLLEPVFVFMRDEVAKPMIGEKYERFMPFILSLFFFILGLNLFSQIPFFPGSANVSGNISVTIVLALFTFVITNINGTGHYWKHIFWMPGIPAWVKIILTPVEVLGLFMKPFTLLVRLFANISAGHMVIVSFVGLIFVCGDSGNNVGGSVIGIIAATVLTLFMNTIELLVAFIQAYIFAILTASYIGAAVEEDHGTINIG